MGRKIDLTRIESDRKRKRMAIAISANDAATVTMMASERGLTSSKVVTNLIASGMEIEQRGRLLLDRPNWPTHPADPRYVQAAFSIYEILDLTELAETAEVPLNKAASAFFKLGLEAYRAKRASKVEEFDFG